MAAPVFGRPDVAAAGQLFVVAAGEPDAVDAARRCSTLSGKNFHLLRDAEVANFVKLSGNFLIASVIEAVGEAMALIGKAGVDRSQYLDFLTSTLFDAPVYKTYGGLIADGKFEPAGLRLRLAIKISA